MSATIIDPTEELSTAAVALQRGELVAFPTETVYGLGANALDAAAVARIFRLKGRPATNPLIVHVADTVAARALAAPGAWSPVAETLAGHFWPGPLTLVVGKSDRIPASVTAGGETVGLRVPAHPVALALLQAAGVPVAAPSANRSEEVSPTTAQHVADSLGPWADNLLILDGGPSQVGIESTVLDVTGDVARILRPGMITAAQIAQVVGTVEEGMAESLLRSPGQMPRHYAPTKPVLLSRDLAADLREGDIVWCFKTSTGAVGKFFATKKPDSKWHPLSAVAPLTPDAYAQQLYRMLRWLDSKPGYTRIVIEEPPHTPEWAAIHDRLRRSATPKTLFPVDTAENNQ